MIRSLIVILLIFSTQLSFSAENDSQGGVIQKYGPRRQISTIVYMGLAGAVLGLSTLSFYGRPQDKLTNIPLGFGVGVVIGTIYMTYQAATNPNKFYRESEYQPNFKYKEVTDIRASDLFIKSKAPDFSYRWTF
jgi:hypothetical protein